MRELKRSMARANMIKAGYHRINKKGYYTNEEKHDSQSFFARNWRKWIFGKPSRKAV